MCERKGRRALRCAGSVQNEVGRLQGSGMGVFLEARRQLMNDKSKYFVIDTNVLLHNPNAIFMFADNEVVIPFDVIEELDKFKTSHRRPGPKCPHGHPPPRPLSRRRATCPRACDVARDRRAGAGRPAASDQALPRPDATTRPTIASSRCAYNLMQEGKRVVFISKDINARIKSDALGIPTEDFEAQKVDFERLYTGWRELTVSGAIDRPALRREAVQAGSRCRLACQRVRAAEGRAGAQRTPPWRAAGRTGPGRAGAAAPRAGLRHHAAQPAADDGAGPAAG